MQGTIQSKNISRFSIDISNYMHTWVEWKQKQDDKVMRRYFDNPKDAPPFAKRLRKQGYFVTIKTD